MAPAADSALRLFFKTFGYRAVAWGVNTANLFGGLEECLACVCVVVGAFTLRASCDPARSRKCRGCCRLPTALLFFLAYTLIRIRPRSTTWPIPSADYFEMPVLRSSVNNASFPSAPAPPSRGNLRTVGPWFRDADHRVAILRGVNLAGGTKLPTRPESGETHKHPDTLFATDPAEISFVGRPFPLDRADEHFSRLRAWGFTFLRLLVTWEAVEHAGPGVYDDEYLTYLRKIVRKAGEYGIGVFIDPHQDVWSRFTGGSGAPRWTLEKAGFNVSLLHESGAAFVHQGWTGAPGEHLGRELPGQVWGHNYGRLAAATMFTLFFGGRDFAPSATVDVHDASGNVGRNKENLQDFLQRHYCAAMARVARELRNEANVLGFDTLNEPSNGWIGIVGIDELQTVVPYGWDTSAFNLLLAGSGFRVDNLAFYRAPMTFTNSLTLNPNSISAWLSPEHDIWRNEGLWDIDADGNPRLLQPDYFGRKPDGSEIDFMNDYMVPFYKRFAKAIRAEMGPDCVIFAEPHINILKGWKETVEPKTLVAEELLDEEQWAWAPHYYDLLSLMSKTFRSWVVIDPIAEAIDFNPVAVHTKVIRHQLGVARHIGERGVPALIGETGICMDMYGGASFVDKTEGAFDMQTDLLNTLLIALDRAFASFTLWNYSPGNTNARGDGWNEEDLSLFSYDQQANPGDLHSGGRALPAVVRPYAARVAGTPSLMRFDAKQKRFTLQFETDAALEESNVVESVIFVPQFQYGTDPAALDVVVSDGEYEWQLEDRQTLLYRHEAGRARHELILSVNEEAAARGDL